MMSMTDAHTEEELDDACFHMAASVRADYSDLVSMATQSAK